MILTVEDFSPKIRDAVDAYYIAKGDARYQELGEELKVPSSKLRDPVSAKVKRYLAVFVSKAYARDRIGTNISQSIDGAATDQWALQYATYDSEEADLVNKLNDWDLLSDNNRESTINTGRSIRSVRISRG